MLVTNLQRRNRIKEEVNAILAVKGPLGPYRSERLKDLMAEADGLEKGINFEHEEKRAAAFNGYLRVGLGSNNRTAEHGVIIPPMSDDHRSLIKEMRDLSTGAQAAYPGATSGFLVPVGFEHKVASALKLYDQVQNLATTITTASGAIRAFPLDNDTTASGEMVGENQQVTEQDIQAIDQTLLGTFKFSSRMVKLSIELATDPGFDIESFLATRFAVRLARATNQQFVNGIGNGNAPTGFITAASSAGVAAGAGTNDGASGANTIGTDDLATLEAAVDPAYRVNATFAMHPNTLIALRKVKDREGRPVFLGLQVGDGMHINGYPIALMPSMDQLQTQASSPVVVRKPIAFGDFSKYQIRRTPMLLVRLAERFAEYGQVGFLLWVRADGNITDAGSPIKFMETSY